MRELENCPRCGQLFVKGIRDICQSCFKEIEEKFQVVYTYLKQKKNREASMREVADNTGVSEADIIKFIREGRLHLNQFPNLSYPCESCGREIREGRICDSCQKRIYEGLETAEKEEDRQRRLTDKEKERYKTYYSLNDRLK